MRKARTDAAARLTAALTGSAPDLLRYLQRRLDHADAADALGDVMVTAWRRVDALPTEAEAARMWLFTIARNTAANASRASQRRRQLTERLGAASRGAPLEHRPSDDGSEVRDAIDRLQPEQAELVRLIHWDGFSVLEAAQILQLNPSTARTRYQRARNDLRSALAEPVADPPPARVTGHPTLGGSLG